MTDDLIKEVNELPNPERNLLTHNERELINLCYRLRVALEAQARRIAELEHTSKCHVEGFVKQCEIANKQAHRIAELGATITAATVILSAFGVPSEDKNEDAFNVLSAATSSAARAAYLGEKE